MTEWRWIVLVAGGGLYFGYVIGQLGKLSELRKLRELSDIHKTLDAIRKTLTDIHEMLADIHDDTGRRRTDRPPDPRAGD